MGDNRDVAKDSRFEGFVLRDRILGKITEKSNTKELTLPIK